MVVLVIFPVILQTVINTADCSPNSDSFPVAGQSICNWSQAPP